MKQTYAVVIEWAETNYSAYVPDLPGCITTGDTLAEVTRNIREAIDFHLEGLQEDGDPIPAPRTRVAEVEVDIALEGPLRRQQPART